jgi:hypothetical protein
MRDTSWCGEDVGVLTVEIDSETERVLSKPTAGGRSAADVVHEAIHLTVRLCRI